MSETKRGRGAPRKEITKQKGFSATATQEQMELIDKAVAKKAAELVPHGVMKYSRAEYIMMAVMARVEADLKGE